MPVPDVALDHHTSTVYAYAENGLKIAYEDVGDGPPLVLLHGLTETRESWWEAGYVAQLLQRGYRLILVDCRGHGESDKPHDPAAYLGRIQAADVLSVLDHAGVERATLVGYSMGGAIALSTAIYHPERLSALIVNGAHPFAEDLSPIRSLLKHSIVPWLEFLALQDPDLSLSAYWRVRNNDLAAVQASIAEDSMNLFPAVHQLKIPLMVVGGELDARFQLIERFSSLCRAEFLPLPGKNHIAAFLAADTVADAMDEFLRRKNFNLAESRF